MLKVKKKLKIFNGDCLTLLNNIPDKSIDLLLTDPPYNIGNFVKSRNRNISNMNRSDFAIEGWDNDSISDFNNMIDSFFKISVTKIRDGGTLLMFSSFLKVPLLIELAQNHKFYFKTVGIWHKTNPMPRNMNLHFVNSNEAWLYFVNNKHTGTFNNNGKLILDFIESSVVPFNEKTFGKHSTQKPISIMKHFISILSNENDLVCDPFMGSGTVGVACKELNRKFIGIELNQEYFNIANKRIMEE